MTNDRHEALIELGACCAFCGEWKEGRLQIDHINDDGRIDRKYSGQADTTARKRFYRRIIKDGPAARRYARVLCASCNNPKEKTRKILERYDAIRCLLFDELKIEEPSCHILLELIRAYREHQAFLLTHSGESQ